MNLNNKKTAPYKDLIIIRGLPGAGKSELAKKFSSKAICTADDYYTDINGNYNWDVSKIGHAHEWCQKKCRKFMQKGIQNIIVANTSTTQKELKPYMDLAREFGYRTFSIIIENRHEGKSVHEVPEKTMDKMEGRFHIKLR